MFKKISLKLKILLLLPILFIASFVAISYLVYYNFIGVSQQNILSFELGVNLSKKQQIEDFLSSRQTDVLFLSQLKSLKEYVNADNSEDRDLAKDSVADYFLSFAETKGLYDQIRYIDASGQEVVRVDTDANGSRILPSSFLQNKKDRYYFENSIDLNQGQIYVSPLDLNIEHGEIEVPYIPVIRYATPVFDNDNQVQGVVVVNVYASYFLDNINTIQDGGQNYLINQDGYYLQHQDPEKTWGFMTGKEETFNNDFPHLAKEILVNEEGQLFDAKTNSYVSFATIDLTSLYGSNNALVQRQGERYWHLISIKEKNSELLTNFSHALYRFIIVIGILLVVVIAIVVLFVRHFFERLFKIQHGVKLIGQGNLNYRLKSDWQDELGKIAQDFNGMADALQEANKNIDSKVKKQTKDIKQQAEQLEEQQVAVLNVLDDVEKERTKVKRERDKINAILHSIGDAVFVVDKKMRIISFNKIASEISGYTAKEVIGKPYKKVLKFIFEKDRKVNDWFVKEAMATGEIQTMARDTLLISRHGEEIPVADSAAPLKNKDGSVGGCVVVFRDVSHEREIDKMKTEFVSLASHQLRTPLTAMRWSIEEMISGELDQADKEEYMNDTLESVVRLSKLVNNLLNISRLETGKLNVNPKPVDLGALLTDVINDYKQQAADSDLSLKLSKPRKKLKKIKLDPTLIREVFVNLVDNAIKYSVVDKNAREVKVKLEVIDDNALVTVADQGIGITRKDKKRIFEKFFRADNAVKKQAEGNGLGLYIIKMVVEASGGRIWFESDRSGSKFFVELPLTGSKAREGGKQLAGKE